MKRVVAFEPNHARREIRAAGTSFVTIAVVAHVPDVAYESIVAGWSGLTAGATVRAEVSAHVRCTHQFETRETRAALVTRGRIAGARRGQRHAVVTLTCRGDASTGRAGQVTGAGALGVALAPFCAIRFAGVRDAELSITGQACNAVAVRTASTARTTLDVAGIGTATLDAAGSLGAGIVLGASTARVRVAGGALLHSVHRQADVARRVARVAVRVQRAGSARRATCPGRAAAARSGRAARSTAPA
jgi:hypothetical protein